MNGFVKRVLWALFATFAAAAPAAAGSWEWGVRGGVSFARFQGDFADVVDFDDRLGMTTGLFGRFLYTSVIGLQAEALYTQKGAKITWQEMDQFGNLTGREFDSYWKVDYLEIPVLGRFVIAPTARMRPFLVMGPAVGILLSGRFDDEGGFDQDLTDLKKVDLGVAGGLGMTWDLAEYRMGLEGRYTRGLSDIYDLDDNLSSINSVFTIALEISR